MQSNRQRMARLVLFGQGRRISPRKCFRRKRPRQGSSVVAHGLPTPKQQRCRLCVRSASTGTDYFDTNVSAHHHVTSKNSHENLVDIRIRISGLQTMPETCRGATIARESTLVWSAGARSADRIIFVT